MVSSYKHIFQGLVYPVILLSFCLKVVNIGVRGNIILYFVLSQQNLLNNRFILNKQWLFNITEVKDLFGLNKNK